MRDIRSDLQERANLIEQEIANAVGHFERAIERLQGERDTRVAELKAELAVLGVLIESEQQRMPNDQRPIEFEQQRMPNDPRPIESEHQRMPSGPRPIEFEHQRKPSGPRPVESQRQPVPSGQGPIESEHQRMPSGPRPMVLPRQSLADFLTRSLAETGPRSQDDLSNFAVREGYFPDAERALPGVHATLVDLLHGDRIRQLPDGTLAPAMVSQMIRRQVV
jgi:hypothetical protein